MIHDDDESSVHFGVFIYVCFSFNNLNCFPSDSSSCENNPGLLATSEMNEYQAAAAYGPANAIMRVVFVS